MTKEYGVLELICGPSGAGKTTLMEHRRARGIWRGGEMFIGGIQQESSFRVTTRPPREGEIDTREYHPVTAPVTHGYFVPAGDFRKFSDEGSLVGVHRYPDPATGEWYGFHISHIARALLRGIRVREQISVYGPVKEIAEYFSARGVTVETELVLAPYIDLGRRRTARGDSEAQRRKRRALVGDQIDDFLRHRNEFGRLTIGPPEILYGEKAEAAIRKSLDELEAGRIPEEIYDDLYGWFQAQWYAAEEGERIAWAVQFHRKMLENSSPVVRNHFFYEPDRGNQWSKINFLRFGSVDLPRDYATQLGLAEILEERGMLEEAQKERMKIVEVIEAVIRTFEEGTELEIDARGEAVVSGMVTPFLDRRKRLETSLYEGGRVEREQLGEAMGGRTRLYRELFSSLRELHHYLQIRDWSRALLFGRTKATKSEFYNAVEFNLVLEERLKDFEKRYTARQEEYKAPKADRAFETTEKARFWRNTMRRALEEKGELSGTTMLAIKNLGEATILNSLANQVRSYVNILTHHYIRGTEAELDGTLREHTKRVAEEVWEILTYCLIGAPRKLPVAMGFVEAELFHKQLFAQTRDIRDRRVESTVFAMGFPGEEEVGKHMGRWWIDFAGTVDEAFMRAFLARCELDKLFR